ncbi:MAG: hypothetical protein IIC80_01275 [Chloroflexi bacterium]|nr:hypothetical protein [Chloroflexota bacterium]
MQDGKEYFIEVGYDADTVGNNPTIKLDGVTLTLNQTGTPSGTVTSEAALDLIIGDLGVDDFDGIIYEYRLYDADGISDSITQQLNGNETNLVLLYTFEEGTGSIVRDNSSNSNDGTITAGSGGWTIDPALAGNAGALLQLRLEDAAGGTAWTANKTIYIGARSGEKRTDTLFFPTSSSATEGTDPGSSSTSAFTSGTTGGLTTNANGGASGFVKWAAGSPAGVNWVATRVECGYVTFQIPGGSLPKGLFRVLARVAITDNIQNANFKVDENFVALGYSQGGESKTPTAVDDIVMPNDSSDHWHLLDFGELSIPLLAVPDGFTPPALDIRIHWITDLASAAVFDSDNGDFASMNIDYLFLLPIDEASLIVGGIDATDELLLDMISNPPGVWFLNTSSVAQEIPNNNGGPMRLGPEATRIYVIKDDPGDPTTVQTFAYAKLTPLVSGV